MFLRRCLLRRQFSPSSGKAHQQVYESFSDGSWLQWDNYSFDPRGNVAGAGAAGGTGLLSLGYQQVVTSSHFGGRRIDLIVQPRLLVQAGLLQ